MRVAMRARKAFTTLLIGCSLAAGGHVLADAYDPPSDYYTTVTGNPGTLKNELHLIISDNYWTSRTGPGGTFAPNGSGHRSHSYDDAKYALPVVDRDPNNASRVILAYNGASVQGAWSSGGTIWNREHRWPRSWGLGSSDGSSNLDHNDHFQLAPCNPSINSLRGNDAYGTTTSSGSYSSPGSYFYPGDNDQPDPDFGDDTGDASRTMFYMAVRYDGNESNTMDLELRNGSHGTGPGDIYYGGDLASCLLWHYRDVPSAHERRRNHNIFSQSANPSYYQGNRNPFIDHPEYVWAIFGDGANDSRIYVGGAVPSDGASTLVIDLGSIPVGTPVPPIPDVTLNKIGTDPTYFEVTSTGDVTCNLDGRYNAFTYGSGSTTLELSLPVNSAFPGSYSGTVTVDNLDLTQSGSGTGVLDGNDTITVSLVVGNCFSPSVDSDGDGDVDMKDFAVFQQCHTGIDDPQNLYGSLPTICECMDVEGAGNVPDSDIDEDDLLGFLGCLSGEGVVSSPTCLSP